MFRAHNADTLSECLTAQCRVISSQWRSRWSCACVCYCTVHTIRAVLKKMSERLWLDEELQCNTVRRIWEQTKWNTCVAAGHGAPLHSGTCWSILTFIPMRLFSFKQRDSEKEISVCVCLYTLQLIMVLQTYTHTWRWSANLEKYERAIL